MIQAAALQTLDLEARTVEVVFTTGALVNHWVWHKGDVRRMPTRIDVTPEAIDLAFLKASGPVLDSHQSWDSRAVIGVVEDAWVKNGEGRAVIRFADTEDVEPIWQRVSQGILRNVSAGFEVLEQEARTEDLDGGGEIEVIHFSKIRVVEISMCAVPADRGSRVQSDAGPPLSFGQVYRPGETADPSAQETPAPVAAQVQAADAAEDAIKGETDMADKTQSAAPVAPTPTPVDAAAIRQQAAQDERARIAGIDTVAQQLGADEALVTQAKEDGMSVDAFRTAAVDAFAAKAQADTRGIGGARQTATVQADAREKFVQGAELGVMARAGLGGERNEFTGLTLSELARQSLDLLGIRSPASRLDMVGMAFTQAGSHTTSDFAHILSSIAGKAALKGWEEAEETFQLWTSVGTLTDFKPTTRVGLGLLDALPEVVEGANYTYGTVGDRGEPITLATYGRLFRITRQAIINDDLSMLSSIPMKGGRAARRTIGNLVYGVLTGNPNMSDGTALFHADHNNLAGSGAAPSIATLSAGRTAMKTQKEREGGPSLNIRPAYILSPAALETDFDQLINSTVDPTATKGHAKNPVAGMAEVISDARLDDASATAWYLAANPAAFDTIEVAYLDGVQSPYIEQKTGWTSDGVELKVRIDAGVAPLDFRTMYKNAGA
ncbi:unknown protein encoded within prophage CP-933U [Sagittula stellata E-37]|uniref:Prohead serine protease domain-containing protein n=2 Tax=Sagittula stellata TaxID=52603 RepID=A3K1Z7_SAGS3|nr:unknown protein encoded within prophage CP-933U [Sagittula stellata E-37]